MSFCSIKTQETVNAEWNGMAGDWDDLASGYRDSFYNILWEETGLDPKNLDTIIDFGCGTGLLTESLVKSCRPDAKIICIDAADDMIGQVKEKIQSREWTNVEAYTIIMSRINSNNKSSHINEETRQRLTTLINSADLIVASSVMSFIPKLDVTKTMEELGKLLKPRTGLFCHSDWPKSEEDPTGFSEESARTLFQKGNMDMKSNSVRTIRMGLEDASVFVGVAVSKKIEEDE